MSFSHELPHSCQGFARLAPALNRRSAARFVLLLVGAILARGRRTVTSWIRAVGLSDQFRSCYIAVAAAGKKAQSIASLLVINAIRPALGRVERLTVSLDDTPTRPLLRGLVVGLHPVFNFATLLEVPGGVARNQSRGKNTREPWIRRTPPRPPAVVVGRCDGVRRGGDCP